MGTNYFNFLKEALRVMKIGGYLIISEILSRFDNLNHFLKNMETLGVKLVRKNNIEGYFFFFVFEKIRDCTGDKVPQFSWAKLLKPCIYKKR